MRGSHSTGSVTACAAHHEARHMPRLRLAPYRAHPRFRAAVAELGVVRRFCAHRMRTTLLVSSISMLLLSSCAHSSPAAGDAATTSLLFPSSSGAQEARRDIAAGRLQLMEAGTRGVFAPNVPTDDRRFSKLPRHRLPSGCTVPNATAWIRYAEAYNFVVVAHVQKQATR